MKATELFITPDDFEMLRNCVGDTNDASTLKPGWRNHYAVGEHGVPGWERLCDAGLARRAMGAAEWKDYPYSQFQATDDGLALVREQLAKRRRAAGLKLWCVSPRGKAPGECLYVWAPSAANAKYQIAMDAEFTGFADSVFFDALKRLVARRVKE